MTEHIESPIHNPLEDTAQESSKNEEEAREETPQETEMEEGRCAAGQECTNPREGDNTSLFWTQCVGECDQWYHVACTGQNTNQLAEGEDFVCEKCKLSME